MVGTFFSSLKKSRIRKLIYKARELARADNFNLLEIFTITIDIAVIWVASVRKRSIAPTREADEQSTSPGESSMQMVDARVAK